MLVGTGVRVPAWVAAWNSRVPGGAVGMPRVMMRTWASLNPQASHVQRPFRAQGLGHRLDNQAFLGATAPVPVHKSPVHSTHATGTRGSGCAASAMVMGSATLSTGTTTQAHGRTACLVERGGCKWPGEATHMTQHRLRHRHAPSVCCRSRPPAPPSCSLAKGHKHWLGSHLHTAVLDRPDLLVGPSGWLLWWHQGLH